MVSLSEDGWELENAEERAAEAPETFRIPPADVRTGLKAGQLARLLFIIEGDDATGEYVQPERMWVEIQERMPDGYKGALVSAPGTPGALDAGAIIRFGPEHIAGVAD